MSEPKISVIVPVYNIEKNITRCVKSILSQSFTDFEILLINDGSTDHSKEICEELQTTDPRITLYNKINGGLSDARNYGIERAKGEYISFVDGDDYIEHNFLDKLYDAIKKTNSDVAICGYKTVDETGNLLQEIELNEKKNLHIITGRQLIESMYENGGVVNVIAWDKLYKKETFSKYRFTKGVYFEDEFLVVPFFWNISRIALVRDELYCYVQRVGSITHSPISIKKLRNINQFKIERINFFKNNKSTLLEKSIEDYLKWILFITKYKDEIHDRSFWKYLKKQYKRYYKTKKYRVNLLDRIIFWAANYNIMWTGQARAKLIRFYHMLKK